VSMLQSGKSGVEMVEAIQYQLEGYGGTTASREEAAAELLDTMPGLSAAVGAMTEEAGGACYMAARMIRECVLLIQLQGGCC